MLEIPIRRKDRVFPSVQTIPSSGTQPVNTLALKLCHPHRISHRLHLPVPSELFLPHTLSSTSSIAPRAGISLSLIPTPSSLFCRTLGLKAQTSFPPPTTLTQFFWKSCKFFLTIPYTLKFQGLTVFSLNDWNNSILVCWPPASPPESK